MEISTLRLIESSCNSRFAQVAGGIPYLVSTGAAIPAAHLCDPPGPDGFYVAHAYTCEGSCEIGRPLPGCNAVGKRCAKYMLEPIKAHKVILRVDAVESIIDQAIGQWRTSHAQ